MGGETFNCSSPGRHNKYETGGSDNESDGEETMTNDKLKKLELVFAEADEDGGGGLHMEEFRHAMRQSMGKNISDQDLDQIFMKVDTNCDGTVDWDEYLTYMLLECREKDIMNVKAQQPFPQPLRDSKPSGHRDSVVRILFMPTYSHKDDMSSGRYISVSRDGIVCFWTLSLKLGAVHKIEAPPPRTKDIWITDACYMPSAHYVGFSTTSRDIILYEVGTNGLRFNKLSRINGLDTCASRLHYYDGGMAKDSILMFGDCRGGVGAVRFRKQPQYTVLNVKGKKNTTYLSLAFAKILKGDVDGIEGTFINNLHGDEVRQVMYCPSLGCFLSCSGATDTALFLGDLSQRLHQAYFTVLKGVNCFDYSYTLNVIVTGGYDTIIRVWNPYVPTRPSIHLQGHQTPVLHVVINNPRELIISMSENKEVRIHDKNTQVCLQTLYRKQMMGLGKRPVLAVFFNYTKQDFVAATKVMAILEQKNIDFSTPYIQSQETPISAALYNPLFKQVVSVGENAMIYVWSVTNGDKVIQFSAGKTVENENPEEGGNHSEITTMTFDPTMRRLLTAAKDGAVKIWNFNNGACLRELPVYDATEITGIVCPKQRIITGGWNKRLTAYMDVGGYDATRWLAPSHRNDILHMAIYPPSTLASCSYDGDIFIWNLDIDRLMYCLNVNTSIYPQTLSSRIGPNVGATAKSSEEYFKHAKTTARRRGVICKMPGASMLEEKNQAPPVTILSSTSDEQEGVGDKSMEYRAKLGTEAAKEASPPSSKATTDTDKETPKPESNVRYDDGEYAPPPTNTVKFAVEKLVFLQTRPLKEDTATLLAGHSDGFVRAWSVHHKGRLLGEFTAAHNQGETLTAMVTDSTNKYVITGDSGGYIKVWGVANYCVEMDSEIPLTLDKDIKEEYNSFPFVKWRQLVLKTCKRNKSWMANPRLDDGSYPMLINSFRGHLSGVISLDVAEMPKRKLFVSTGSDQSIRLWSIDGQFLGIFGVKKWWIGVDNDGFTRKCDNQQKKKSKYKQPHSYGSQKTTTMVEHISSIPTDIKAVASATTLRVLNAGNKDFKFKLPKLVMRCIAKITARGSFKGASGASMNLFDMPESQSSLHIPSMTEMEMEKESLVQSSILLRSYKRTTRHKKLPKLPNMTRNPFTDSICVFRNLPYTELVPVPSIPMPETMKEIIQRKGNQAKEAAERAKLLAQINRRRSQTRGSSRMSRKAESPTYTPSGHEGSNNGALYETRRKRLSVRIEDVLEKAVKSPPIKPGAGNRIETTRNSVNKKLEAIRSSGQLPY